MVSYVLFVSIIILDLTVGSVVYFKNRKSTTNISFFWLTFLSVVWIFSNFFENEPILRDYGQLFLKVDFASAALLAYFFVYFCLNFPTSIKTSLFKNIFIALFPLICSILSFFDLVIKDISFNEGILFKRGDLYWVYALMLTSYIIIGCLNLILKIKKLSGIEKVQAIYVVLGLTLSTLVAVPINLILTQITEIPVWVNRMGIYGFLFFILFTAYAVLKHHLMEIRVVTTELLSGLAILTLFIDLFLSESILVTVFKTAVLIIFIFLGISLVKSVLREIEQKEKIEKLYESEKKAKDAEKQARIEVEKMAEKVQHAYEVEKRALETEKKAHELDRQARELEAKANEGLRDLNEKKDQFMNATQHHLRTPLTAMRGFVDLAMGGTYGKIPLKIEEMLHRFEISSKLLLDLINDFLDVSQIQLGKKIVMLKDNIRLEPMLGEITREVNYVIETDPRFRAKGNKIYFKIHLPKEKLPFIQADPIKLKVALFNVFNNAVRYTEAGGVDVSITINPKPETRNQKPRTTNPSDLSTGQANSNDENPKQITNSNTQTIKQTILIAVKDTGIGITKQEMPKLFSGIFDRNARSMRTNATGKGIGLYFTNNIIKEHNGAIWAESEGEGKGSTFFVELPIQPR